MGVQQRPPVAFPSTHEAMTRQSPTSSNPTLTPNMNPNLHPNPNIYQSLTPDLNTNLTQFPNNPHEAATLQLQQLNALLGTLYAITSNYQSQAAQNYNPLFTQHYPHYPSTNGTFMHNGTYYGAPQMNLDIPQGIQFAVNPSAVPVTEKPKAVGKRNTQPNTVQQKIQDQAGWISEQQPGVATEKRSAYYLKNDLPNQIESSENVLRNYPSENQDLVLDSTSISSPEETSTSAAIESKELGDLDKQLRPESLETIPLDLIKHLVYKEMQANKVKYIEPRQEKAGEQDNRLDATKVSPEISKTPQPDPTTPLPSIIDNSSDLQDVTFETAKPVPLNKTNQYEQMRVLNSINPNFLAEIPETPSMYDIFKPEFLKTSQDSRLQNEVNSQGIKVPVTCMHCGGDQKVILTWSKPIKFRVHTVTIIDKEEEIIEERGTACGCVKAPNDVVVVKSNANYGDQDLMSIRRSPVRPLRETIPQIQPVIRYPLPDFMPNSQQIAPRINNYNEIDNAPYGSYPSNVNNDRNKLNYYYIF